MPAGALKGDKKTYNMDPANGDEAVREVAADLRRGRGYGDGQPGLPYLDNCARLKAEFRVPTVAYQVSEEYAMIVAAEERGWIDGFRAVLETLLAFRRAGCDGVPTNFAPRAARLLRVGAGRVSEWRRSRVPQMCPRQNPFQDALPRPHTSSIRSLSVLVVVG